MANLKWGRGGSSEGELNDPELNKASFHREKEVNLANIIDTSFSADLFDPTARLPVLSIQQAQFYWFHLLSVPTFSLCSVVK